MRRLGLLLLLAVAACAPQQGEVFTGSTRPALEMRVMQTRAFEGEANLVARGVVATLQDLGYRITRVDAGSGTISATRADRLRMATVVRSQEPGRSVVRANAAILLVPGQVREVDSAEFYQGNFFAPLSAMLGREGFALAPTQESPDAVRPEGERLATSRPTLQERPQ